MGQPEDGLAGDAGQNASGELRSEESAIIGDGHEVHATELLDPGVLDGVEEEHLGAPAILCGKLCSERGGVVAATLGGTGTTGNGTHLVTLHPDVDGTHPVGEVCADRGAEDGEAHLASWRDSQEVVIGEHHRTQVETLLT